MVGYVKIFASFVNILSLSFNSLTYFLFPPHECTAAYSVSSILQSIQSLLGDANVDSPLNVHAAKLWQVNDAEYKEMVMRTYSSSSKKLA